MDECDEIMTLGLADVSHMSIFNDFDETNRGQFHGRIIDQFSMITVDSAPANDHESTLGTGTNDFGDDTRAHTTLYSGQVEGACGLFGNSIDAGNTAANISDSKCYHTYNVEDELLSMCDHKSCVNGELLSNCNTNVMFSTLGVFFTFDLSGWFTFNAFSHLGVIYLLYLTFFFFLLSSTSVFKIYITVHNYYSSLGSLSLKTPGYKVSIIKGKELASTNTLLY